jgi:hypothetical protein
LNSRLDGTAYALEYIGEGAIETSIYPKLGLPARKGASPGQKHQNTERNGDQSREQAELAQVFDYEGLEVKQPQSGQEHESHYGREQSACDLIFESCQSGQTKDNEICAGSERGQWDVVNRGIGTTEDLRTA